MKTIYVCTVCGQYTESPRHCGAPCRLILGGKERLRLSRLLSGLLRHFPEAAGLKIRRDGFTEQSVEEVAELIKTWRKEYFWLRPEHILAIAILDPKGRFEIRDGRIRARYGHSIRVNIEYEEPPQLPSMLYHGTSTSLLPSIMREGLRPMRRLKVHLTSSIEDARENARRKGGRPVILAVDVNTLRKRGLKIFKAGRNVYVTDYVPPDAIKVVATGPLQENDISRQR